MTFRVPILQKSWAPPLVDTAPVIQRSKALLAGPQLMPFRFNEWPRPPDPPIFLALFGSVNIALPNGGTKPFAQYTWPLPIPAPRIDYAPVAQRNIPLLAVTVTLPRSLYDWPIPARPPRVDTAPAVQRSVALLSGPQVSPSRLTEWPGPTAPSRIDYAAVVQRNIPLLTATILSPFALYDWPIPTPPRRIDTAPVVQRNLPLQSGPQVSPFAQTYWPLPVPPYRIDYAPVVQRSVALISGPQVSPGSLADWPGPIPPARVDYASVVQRSQSLISGTQLKPFSQMDWPGPVPPYRVDYSPVVQRSLSLTSFVQPPFAQYYWPLPIPPYRIEYVGVYQRSLALVAGPQVSPIAQRDWPPPTPTYDRRVGVQPNPPFNINLYPPPPAPPPVIVPQGGGGARRRKKNPVRPIWDIDRAHQAAVALPPIQKSAPAPAPIENKPDIRQALDDLHRELRLVSIGADLRSLRRAMAVEQPKVASISAPVAKVPVPAPPPVSAVAAISEDGDSVSGLATAPIRGAGFVDEKDDLVSAEAEVDDDNLVMAAISAAHDRDLSALLEIAAMIHKADEMRQLIELAGELE